MAPSRLIYTTLITTISLRKLLQTITIVLRIVVLQVVLIFLILLMGTITTMPQVVSEIIIGKIQCISLKDVIQFYYISPYKSKWFFYLTSESPSSPLEDGDSN